MGSIRRFIVPAAGYVALLALCVFLYNYIPSPAFAIGILGYIAVGEFVVLLHYVNKYVHWLFYRKYDVVKETKEVLLVYIIFLVLSIATNSLLHKDALLVVLAIGIPPVTLLTSVVIECARYLQADHRH